jgi:hypothetical protein
MKWCVTYSDEKTMITIGDVCPLSFNTLQYEYANEGSFRQCFDVSDGILLQVFCDEGEKPTADLNNLLTSKNEEIGFKTYSVNDLVTMYYTYLYPSEGIYTITISGKESNEFEVCEDSCGALVEYTHKDNNSPFDNIFWVGSDQLSFKLRIPGGFKPSGVSMEVDNEQFLNQYQEIVELYSIPYTTRVFSMGDVNGLPYYMAELMNRILCLSDVHINGEQYVREGNSKPEKVETIGRKELFMWSVTLRQRERRISGIGGKLEEPYSASGASFKLDNPSDGEVLVYDNSESSFVNSNTLDSI